MCRLVGIGREQRPSGEAVDECDVDRRPGGLEPAAIGRRFAQGSADLLPVLVEYENVRRKGIVGGERTSGLKRFVVASARNAVPGFENEDLEVACIAEKGDAGRGIQTRGENRRREPCGKIDWMAAGSDRKRRCCPYTAGAVSDLRSSLTLPKKCRATPATLPGRPLRSRFANGSLAWREFPPPSAAEAVESMC